MSKQKGVSGLEDRKMEIIESDEEKEKRLKKNIRISRTFVTVLKYLRYQNLEYQKHEKQRE